MNPRQQKEIAKQKINETVRYENESEEDFNKRLSLSTSTSTINPFTNESTSSITQENFENSIDQTQDFNTSGSNTPFLGFSNPPTTMDIKSFKKQIALHIPKYNGRKYELNRFLNAVSDLFDTIPEAQKDNIPALLKFVITQHAPNFIYERISSINFDSVEKFKKELSAASITSVDLEQIQKSLNFTKQANAEPIRDFANRIKRFEVELRIAMQHNNIEDTHIESLVTKSLFNAFVRNMLPTLNQICLSQKIDSIEKGVEALSKFEQLIPASPLARIERALNNLQLSTPTQNFSSRNFDSRNYNRSHFSNNYQNFQPQNSRPIRSLNYGNKNFPSNNYNPFRQQSNYRNSYNDSSRPNRFDPFQPEKRNFYNNHNYNQPNRFNQNHPDRRQSYNNNHYSQRSPPQQNNYRPNFERPNHDRQDNHSNRPQPDPIPSTSNSPPNPTSQPRAQLTYADVLRANLNANPKN